MHLRRTVLDWLNISEGQIVATRLALLEERGIAKVRDDRNPQPIRQAIEDGVRLVDAALLRFLVSYFCIFDILDALIGLFRAAEGEEEVFEFEIFFASINNLCSSSMSRQTYPNAP